MARANSKQVLVLALRLSAVAVLSAACASVLGIETTKRTNRANNGYGSGYEGCRKNSCGECLSSAHTTACQGPAGYGTGYEGCRAGDCSQCQDAHDDECTGEAGYGSGYDGCVGGECGGCLSGAHTCLCQNLQPGCFLVEGDAGVDPQICDQSNLDDCADCLCGSCDLSTCLADSACNEVFSCVAQKACSPALSATDTCYATDYCKDVVDAAGGPNGPAYTAMLSVINCSTTEECSCTFGSPGTSMGTCEAGVDCPNEGGTGPTQCQAPSCMGCETTSAECLCNGNSADECLTAVLGRDCEAHFEVENDVCNGCSCGACTSELLSCFDDPASGCMTLARCINIHGCSGADCDTREACGDLLDRYGGVDGRSFQMATALSQCQAAGDCACTHEGDTAVISCDDSQCSPFVDPNADASADSLAACCFQQQGQSFCGLEATGVLYAACEPLDLSGSPSTACNGFQAPEGFPYDGAFLPGCCRPTTANSAQNGGPGVCGYNDNVTGLGCLPKEKVNGMSTTPTPCNYVR